MNLNIDLNTKFFRKKIAKVSINLIKMKDKSVQKNYKKASETIVRYVALDGSYTQNNRNAQMIIVTAMTLVQGLYKIIGFKVLKRPQGLESDNLISGDFKRCRADQLEGFATKEVLESIVDLEPEFLVFDGDASLNKIVDEISWTKKPKIAPDLSHLLKNIGKQFFRKNNIFIQCGINGQKNGLGHNNRSFVIDHIQQSVRYFSRNIPEKNRTYETWKQICEKNFKHLSGENVFENNHRCPVYKCKNKNYFEQLSDEKIKKFEGVFYETFLAPEFWEKYVNTGSTSCLESFHSKSFRKFVNKNVTLNIKTRTTEARFSVSCVNFNEGLSGFIEYSNDIDDMKNWPIGSFCANKLISHANTKKRNTENNFYNKKTIKYDRIKAQKQNSSIETTDGLYKPKKIKIEKKN